MKSALTTLKRRFWTALRSYCHPFVFSLQKLLRKFVFPSQAYIALCASLKQRALRSYADGAGSGGAVVSTGQHAAVMVTKRHKLLTRGQSTVKLEATAHEALLAAMGTNDVDTIYAAIENHWKNADPEDIADARSVVRRLFTHMSTHVPTHFFAHNHVHVWLPGF